MERDLDGYERNEDQLIISTHTLTWSVTLDKYKFVADWYNFNSHAHVERDGRRFRQTEGHHNFNSHAHVERDT